MARSASKQVDISTAKQNIHSGNFGFFMRTKSQEEYHPDKAQYTNQWFKMAFKLRDMATLCDDEHISHYILVLSRKLDTYVDTGKMTITSEELKDIVTFIRNGKVKYDQSKYVDLSKL